MPHDPARIEDTRAWLRKAALDLDTARILRDHGSAQLGNCVFHCQQAAEKAFKAFLAWHDEPFRKTHNLEELGRQVAALDPTFLALIDRAATLTAYAWQFRYPGEPEWPTPEEAEEALATAREVYEAVLARLPEEARP
jgi:HEPN domain-containing protein